MGIIERNIGNLHDQDTGALVGYRNPVTGKQEDLNAPALQALVSVAGISAADDFAAALQATMDSMETRGGGIVIIPPGAFTYTALRTLWVPDEVTVWAYGATVAMSAAVSQYLIQPKNARQAVYAPNHYTATATPSASGGTLSAGAKAYVITTITATGESMPCGELTATTTGSMGSVALSWPAALTGPDAAPITGYRVYGRTSGAIGTLLGTTGPSTTVFTDTGMVGTAQALPTRNTTFPMATAFRVLGGTWDQGRTVEGRPANTAWQVGNWVGHCFNIQRVEEILLRDMTIKGAPKWAIAVADFGTLTTEHIKFDTLSDGCHVLGPGTRWVSKNLTGTVGDDMIGVSLVEWPDYAASEGDIGEVIADDTQVTNAFAAVRVLGGTLRTLGSITLCGVTGTLDPATTATAAVYMNNDQNNPGRAGTTIGTVSVSGVDVVTPAGKRSVHFAPTAIARLEIDGVKFYGAASSGVTLNSGTFGKVDIKNVVAASGAASAFGVLLSPGTTVTVASLTVDGLHAVNPADGGFLGVDIRTGSTVDSLIVSRAKIEQSGTGTLVKSAGTLRHLWINDADVKTIATVVDATAGSLGTISFSGLRTRTITDVFKTLIANTELEFSNSIADSSRGIIRLDGAGATGIRVRSGDVRLVAGAGVSRSASQTVRVDDFRFRVDLAMTSKNAGDQANNTNGALSCGTGPAVCDGATWKNLHSGLTY